MSLSSSFPASHLNRPAKSRRALSQPWWDRSCCRVPSAQGNFPTESSMLAAKPQAAEAARIMKAEHARIRRLLDVVGALTRGFEVPAAVCVSWRVLYVLARKIDLDIREQMKLEERELFGVAHP